jgi:hypothetical protein
MTHQDIENIAAAVERGVTRALQKFRISEFGIRKGKTAKRAKNAENTKH